MNNYWKRAGNARWGMRMLARDIWNASHPKKPMETPRRQEQPQPNNMYREEPKPISTDDVRPPVNQTPTSSPTYVTNYNNYPVQNQPMMQNQPMTQKKFGFWRTAFLVVFMVAMAGFTYVIITNPRAITDGLEMVRAFFHSF